LLPGCTKPVMIEPFADRAWADAHEKFSADVAAGLARLARWFRRAALHGSDKFNTGDLGK
jgi:hypothetical protein